ncbi:MAG: cytochrome c biogenesis protein CcdA [Candidatus Omnitrophica bacterium]|nr:cytochrome c biogenesis protein CcdA [Candidatus Omnitrophota bacterium]MDD5487685.1 cytochrome c biogenesis protein CcdA [Candidatus Omnitrophota bacterium]
MIGNISYEITQVSLLTYLVVYAGGVITSLTPCIYPLIPVTVSVIGINKERSKLANLALSCLYVLGMALTFSVLGMVAAYTGQLFGGVQSSPIAHLIVGNIMIFFALSFLGVVPIPAFLLNKAGAGKVISGGSGLSVFFMGIVSGLIASPCSVSVLGAVLAFVATTRSIVAGFSLLFVYAIGLGTMLVVVGTFAGIVTGLPKSGKALEVLQKVFAFVMILLGEYFIFKAGMLSV